MFYGESTHSLDDKKRVFVPKRFQSALERDADGHLSVVVTRGFEGCLFLFSGRHFDVLLQRLQTQPFGGERLRRMQRLFFANVHRTALDGSGRLVLPEKLRRLAGIEKEVVIVGVADRAEIWDRARWESFERDSEGGFDDLGVVLTGGDAAGGGED
ncbi:MAG: division/cell wall cluster transcriptional repressor MraZ [Planctomycetota bacterium]